MHQKLDNQEKIFVSVTHRDTTVGCKVANPRKLTGLSPRIGRIFPTATLKRYFKGKGLGFRPEIFGLGSGFKCLRFRV